MAVKKKKQMLWRRIIKYPKLEVKYTEVFHDRFLIIDDTIAYHIGASVKDAGRKCFGINLIEDENRAVN